MPEIVLRTRVRAPRARLFDLARSIDAHRASTEGTSERAIAGVTSGLINLGERVTWEARHFGIRQRLTVEIVDMDVPTSFRDVMIEGAFASMSHDHVFEEDGDHTIMVDRFRFQAPLGVLGRVAERLFLTTYMDRLLKKRARALKAMAETSEWERYLKHAAGPSAPEDSDGARGLRCDL